MFFQKNKYQDEIAEIIYEIEIEASKSKTAVEKGYIDYIKNIKKLDPKKSAIAKELEKSVYLPISLAEPTLKVYKKYLPKEIIRLLEFTEKKGDVDRGATLESYREINDMAKALERSVANKMKVPIFTAFLTMLMMYNLIGGFKDLLNDPSYDVAQSAKFVGEYYLYIVTPILSLIAFIFIKYPQKVFGVKKVYAKINTLIIVSSTRTLFKSGSTSVDVIPFLKHTFLMNKLRTLEDTMFDLSKMLYSYEHITDLEATALIEIDSKEINRYFERVVQKRKEDVENIVELVEGFINNIATFLILIPFGIAGYAVGSALIVMFNSIKM